MFGYRGVERVASPVSKTVRVEIKNLWNGDRHVVEETIPYRSQDYDAVEAVWARLGCRNSIHALVNYEVL